MIALLNRSLTVSLGLYVVAVLTTMAGMEIFGWLSFLLIVATTIIDRSSLQRPLLEKSDWALIALMFVIILSALFAAPEGSDRVFIIGNSRFVLLFIAIRLGLERIGLKKAEAFFKWIAVLTGLIAVYAIFQHFTGIDFIRGHREPVSQVYFSSGSSFRGRGMWGHPVTFGHAMALSASMMIAAAAMTPWRSRVKWLYVVVSLVSVLSILWSYTRGAWLGLAAAIAVGTLYFGRRIAVTASVSGAVALGALYSFSNHFRERFHSILSFTDTSNTQRIDVWKANLAMFQDHPILGVGYGVNEEIIGQYYDKLGIQQEFGGHAHNNFLQFLSGTGLLGFASFIGASVLFYWMAHRLLRSLPPSETWIRTIALGALGAQIALQVGGLTECNFKDAEVNHQYMLILALLTVAWRQYTTKKLA